MKHQACPWVDVLIMPSHSVSCSYQLILLFIRISWHPRVHRWETPHTAHLFRWKFIIHLHDTATLFPVLFFISGLGLWQSTYYFFLLYKAFNGEKSNKVKQLFKRNFISSQLFIWKTHFILYTQHFCQTHYTLSPMIYCGPLRHSAFHPRMHSHENQRCYGSKPYYCKTCSFFSELPKATWYCP